MSDAENSHASEVRAEEDVVHSGLIVAVGVAALLVFLGGSVAATWIMSREEARVLPDGPAALPSEAGKAKIGMIEQQLFENADAAASLLREQRRQLESYGWVDRKAGVIHVPVEQGMERVLRGERP